MINQPFDNIPQLQISPKGIFKYILIRAEFDGMGTGKRIVRGSTDYQYHADNFDAFEIQLKEKGFTNLKLKNNKIKGKKDGNSVTFVCEGGGRIEHQYEGKKCSIYGYSQSFGHVDHNYAKEIVSKQLGYGLEEIVLNEKDY